MAATKCNPATQGSVLEDCFMRDFEGELIDTATTQAGNVSQARLAPSKCFFHGNKAFQQVQRLKRACV